MAVVPHSMPAGSAARGAGVPVASRRLRVRTGEHAHLSPVHVGPLHADVSSWLNPERRAAGAAAAAAAQTETDGEDAASPAVKASKRRSKSRRGSVQDRASLKPS